MTRPQENTIERLALEHGRVAVRDHAYADGSIYATLESGAHFKITDDGVEHQQRPDFSQILNGFWYKERGLDGQFRLAGDAS